MNKLPYPITKATVLSLSYAQDRELLKALQTLKSQGIDYEHIIEGCQTMIAASKPRKPLTADEKVTHNEQMISNLGEFLYENPKFTGCKKWED